MVLRTAKTKLLLTQGVDDLVRATYDLAVDSVGRRVAISSGSTSAPMPASCHHCVMLSFRNLDLCPRVAV